ncbi:MAG: hypothetical protein ACOCRO_04455 [Halanaerobiales bacterium]
MIEWLKKKIRKLIKDDKDNYVYVVTMIPVLKYSEPIEGLITEGQWTVGIFKDYDIACEVLENNTTDLWETMYTYAVIEKVEVNYIYACFSTDWTEWYKYDERRNGYFPTDIPESMECNNGFWG